MLHNLEISPHHPALADHFPGTPIVPGAIILEKVVLALKDEIGKEIIINKISRAKFISPLSLGKPATIAFKITNNIARFTCSTDCGDIAIGQLEFTTT